MGILKKLIGGKKPSARVAVIGLDGAPCSLLETMAANGRMPHLAEILAEGTMRAMDAPLPEISSVSWATFFTGCNPGRHGIFGFSDLRPSSYDVYFPNLGDVRGEAVWDIVGRCGGRSVVLNVPTTYPARPLDGVLCSGFVALDLEKATYPDAAYRWLKGIGYRIDADMRLARKSLPRFLEDLKETLALREKALLHFFDEEDWDLFIGVITATDRLQHFFFEDSLSEDSEYHDDFYEIYRETDRFLGEIHRRVKERNDTTLLLMSDHGFTRLEKQVYLNHWLVEKGYLSFGKKEPESLADISSDSRAFALDPSRIYIHEKGRYPRGSVEPGEPARKLREEIAERLVGLELEGRPVLRRVWRREEIYSGPRASSAPDLVLVSEPGFDLKGALAKGVLADRDIFSGMHTPDDAVFYLRGKPLIKEKPRVMDLSPTILALMGLEVPAEMDGRVLLSEMA
ncbi:MAG: alkaline phosphatase family protein [Planctomycetota bacterium]|nr:alkaline phosphatase family protein [Planctomycetota bacterium]